MPCEIPTFKNCCLCLPLRRGLLGYAYLKLVFILLQLMGFATFVPFVIMDTFSIIIIMNLVVVAIDIPMTLAFVIGGHMKNPRLLKVYMWYIILSAPQIAVLASFVCMIIKYTNNEPIVNAVITILYTTLVVVIQLYLVFLVRSEILKLESKGDAIQYQIGDEQTNTTNEGTPKLQNIKYM